MMMIMTTMIKRGTSQSLHQFSICSHHHS